MWFLFAINYVLSQAYEPIDRNKCTFGAYRKELVYCKAKPCVYQVESTIAKQSMHAIPNVNVVYMLIIPPKFGSYQDCHDEDKDYV